MSRDVREVIKKKVDQLRGRVATNGSVDAFVWIAGPFDEDMQGGDMEDIHAEVVNLLELVKETSFSATAVLAVFDLGCCDILDLDVKKLEDCHASLTVPMKGFEHTLAALVVFISQNAATPLSSSGSSDSSFPFVATVYGRDKKNTNLAAATYRNEEMLFFEI